MKTIRQILVICILGMLFTPIKINAQRVVVKTPRRTVVRTNNAKVVYHNRRPAVRVVRTLPKTRVVVNYGGVRYYHSRGVYYRYHNGNYIIIAAPIGIRVNVLPIGYRVVVIGARTYYYYEGSYYIKIENTEKYQVVKAPDDAVVKTLPEDVEEVEIDGKKYYQYDQTLYKVVVTPDGKAFKVVGQLEE